MWRPVLIVFIASIALYSGTIGHDFVWDDVTLIVNNPNVQSPSARTLARIWTEPFAEVEGHGAAYYRPVVTLSYIIDRAVGRGHASWFHASNVGLNALVCALVAVFAHLVFGSPTLAFCTALLFAVHPVHTENVAWIAGRTDILASLWSLLSLCLYVLSRRRRKPALLGAALGAFLLGLLSKESAAGLPLLIVVLEMPCFDDSLSRGTAAKPRRWLRSALFGAVLLLYLLMRQAVVGAPGSSHESYAPGLPGRIGVVLALFGAYVQKALWPASLNAEYDIPIPMSLADLHVAVGMIAVVLLAVLWWRFRRSPVLVLGIAIFVSGLLPVLNLVPIGEIAAERFLYFPSLGVCVLFAAPVASALTTRFPRLREASRRRVAAGMSRLAAALVLAASCLLVAGAVARVVTRVPDWQSELVLFARTAEQNPHNARPFAALATAAARAGDRDRAIAAFRSALAIEPDYTVALIGLAQVYVEEARYEEALPLVERAVRLAPGDQRLRRNLEWLRRQIRADAP